MSWRCALKSIFLMGLLVLLYFACREENGVADLEDGPVVSA